MDITGKTVAQLIGDENFFTEEVDELIGNVEGMCNSWRIERDNRLRKYLHQGNEEGYPRTQGLRPPDRQWEYSQGVAVSMDPVYKDKKVRIEVFEPYSCADNSKIHKQVFNPVHDLSKPDERERFVHNLACLLTYCRDRGKKGKCR